MQYVGMYEVFGRVSDYSLRHLQVSEYLKIWKSINATEITV